MSPLKDSTSILSVLKKELVLSKTKPHLDPKDLTYKNPKRLFYKSYTNTDAQCCCMSFSLSQLFFAL